MRKLTLLLIVVFGYCISHAQEQPKRILRVLVTDEKKSPLPSSTVSLFNKDSVVVKQGAADNLGIIEFTELDPGSYRVQASQAGYETGWSGWVDLDKNFSQNITITLLPKSSMLTGITVVGKKPPVQFLPDRTVINPEASITNAGASLMDVLEKSPGITVGRDGGLIMKGKPAVTVLIDGKPTQLSGADLQAYLSGIAASQVEAIELIENPGAKYDAAGNAGIINIKMKSNRQKGFNGNMNLGVGQGMYPKTNNSLNLNYRNGKFNYFLNYGMRLSKERMYLHTLRKYFDQNHQDSALLEQPNVNRSRQHAQNLKVGIDFFASSKTTLGVFYTGGYFSRKANTIASVDWLDPAFNIDSTIHTWGQNNSLFRRNGINLNGRHKIDEHSEISADLDYVWFRNRADQNFQTQLDEVGSEMHATKGDIPSKLEIVTVKADYTRRFKYFVLEAGAKAAINKTDNLADYYYLQNGNWIPDLSRSNHFLYDERISAAYASVDMEKGKWHWQTGLRYEMTSYEANQLGNSVVKDSLFKRNYGSLFPTAFVSYQADSNNVFSFRLGRRIDRPPFQWLNPFIVTMNKYTYEAGNPFIQPQFTWNFQLMHSYKQMLTTEVSFSTLSDYFSQIFIIDKSSSNVNNNIIIYTRGNVGSFKNFGISETFQQAITNWWNLTAVAVYNHKVIKGVVWAPLEAHISQLNVSLNNQFSLKKGWAFEISGFYQTKSQIDLQEWLKPMGELNLGVSKQIMKGKGTLRLNVRDITYYQNYSGYSTFENSYEPFEVKWDSRVVRLSFNWRFGKAMKPIIRSQGGAAEEIDRAGTGN
jgi:iron complex outermembrane receptor protein